MVRTIKQNDTSTLLGTSKELYQCEECGFHYEDNSTLLITGKKQAEKCEAWCKEHKSCNIEITASAIENKKG